MTSEDKAIKARTYFAPFSFVAVWILDPKTLVVLDKQQGFDHQKLAEPRHEPPLDLSKSDAQKYVAARIASLIEASVGEAVRRSEVNVKHGEVEVGDVKEVTPADDTAK